MKQKFIFLCDGKIMRRNGIYEEILKKFKPKWIDVC